MTIPKTTDVLIVGSGPAGVVLGCLLARRGFDVLLVEKQTTLEREFRGETLAPPSVITLRRLGFGPALARHGYLETAGIAMRMEGCQVFVVDYGHFQDGTLPIDIPQPALIGIVHEDAAALPNFSYVSGTSFTGLIEDGDGVVRGAILKQRDRTRVEVLARLVVGADGRFSKVRKASGLAATITPMARDLLSFKLPRPESWGNQAELVVDRDQHLVILPTFPHFLRIGHNLPKHGLSELKKAGFDRFKAKIAGIDPRLGPIMDEHLRSWVDTSFLEIFTAEMRQWTRDGLILIGDASHTCTPILGQGVNIAIQDAVSLTPVIAAALTRSRATDVITADELAGFVAKRRKHKASVTRFQRMQESALAQRTYLKTALRRARFRTLDRLPLKYHLIGKVINTPHEIDPADVRAHA